MFDAAQLDWEKTGELVPAVVQDAGTGRLLMLAFMNREALDKTIETGWVTFWSRSREELWTKGATSGNYLKLNAIRSDCDRDALLILAQPLGPSCHQGTRSCFGPDEEFWGLEFVAHLERIILDRRVKKPEGSYTSRLFAQGLPEISKKLGEEAVEVVVSAAQSRQRSVEESADLLYHLLVFLAERGIGLAEIAGELKRRHLSRGNTLSSGGAVHSP